MDAAAIGALIGVGRVAEVFAHGADVLKLYRDPGAKPQAFREAAALALVEAAGLPTPRVLGVGEFGGRWGLVMSRAPGPSFGDALLADPAQLPRYLAALVGVHERIHRAAGSGLARLKTRLAAALERAEGLDAATRADLGDRLAALPDGDRLCHGDFHPMNVSGPPEAPVVVDWLDATVVRRRPICPDLAAAPARPPRRPSPRPRSPPPRPTWCAAPHSRPGCPSLPRHASPRTCRTRPRRCWRWPTAPADGILCAAPTRD
ncbi:MAG: phosphotransferase [Devosia sp.]|nr:phosphotransferase [Devosia sp.]